MALALKELGEEVAGIVAEAIAPLVERIKALEARQPERGPQGENGADGAPGKDGRDGIDGKDGAPGMKGADGKDGRPGLDGDKGDPGQDGKNGADGLGVAGSMIDREGSLLITLSNGEVKNLGPVVGKDGRDGQDGIGLDSFEMEYIAETHEVSLKASAAGRVKELRFPAGGIRPAGYWREGSKAKAGEAWVQDGSLWIAMKDTHSKPDTRSEEWILAARKGRDGERGQKGQDGIPPAPVKLNG